MNDGFEVGRVLLRIGQHQDFALRADADPSLQRIVFEIRIERGIVGFERGLVRIEAGIFGLDWKIESLFARLQRDLAIG